MRPKNRASPGLRDGFTRTIALSQVLAGAVRGVGFAHRQSDCAFLEVVAAAPPTWPNSPGVIIVHGHGEFHRIVKRGPGPHGRAAGLQVSPAQRTIDTVEDKNHATFGSFDPHFHEAWKKGASLKSNRTDKASTLNGQALAHLIQYQNGCFHAGVSASIFARRRSVLG